jgi:hypothetical protein
MPVNNQVDFNTKTMISTQLKDDKNGVLNSQPSYPGLLLIQLE